MLTLCFVATACRHVPAGGYVALDHMLVGIRKFGQVVVCDGLFDILAQGFDLLIGPQAGLASDGKRGGTNVRHKMIAEADKLDLAPLSVDGYVLWACGERRCAVTTFSTCAVSAFPPTRRN